MDIHSETSTTPRRTDQRGIIVRYGLCIALSLALLVGGALLAAERPSSTRDVERNAPERRAAAKGERLSPNIAPGGAYLEDTSKPAAKGGLPYDLCRNGGGPLQARRPDSSWVERELIGTGVEARLSHPPDWTADDTGRLGLAVAAPSGDLDVFVTASPAEAVTNVADAMSSLIAELPGGEIRSSRLVELSGVPACHIEFVFEADRGGEVEIWLMSPDGEATIVIFALSFGGATGSDWAAARGIAETLTWRVRHE